MKITFFKDILLLMVFVVSFALWFISLKESNDLGIGGWTVAMILSLNNIHSSES